MVWFICFGIIFLCMMASWIWTIVLGFKTGIHWGFLNMIPFVGFIWMLMHQEEAAGPAKLFAGGFVFFLVNLKFIGLAWKAEKVSYGINHPEENGLEDNPRNASFDGDTVLVDSEGKPIPRSELEEDGESEPVSGHTTTAQATPVPMGDTSATPVTVTADASGAASSVGTGGTAPAPVTQVVAAAPVSAPPPTITTVASNVAPRSFAPSVYIEDAPVDTLWTQYYRAVQQVTANNPQGVRDFEICLCTEDVNWLRQNMGVLAELVAPGLARTSPDAARLAVVRALMRNMPTGQLRGKPEVNRSKSVGVAKLVADSETGPATYTTLILQEDGRWVFVQPFFARTCVWTPQLAQYKRAVGLPLASDEQLYLARGLAPFQQQLQSVYQTVGYK